MQSLGIEHDIMITLEDVVPTPQLSRGNRLKNWEYGYNVKYDIVIISKDGTLGEIVEIQGLRIGLPKAPSKCHSRSSDPKKQYWERESQPEDLRKIKTLYQWNKRPPEFKKNYVSYIEEEFDRRENGFWFMSNGEPVYITGSHYMYLQWCSIDVGYPDFRYANKVLYYFWEACKADPRSYGMIYLKIRRSGFSFMESSEAVNLGTLASDSRIGILSKTGADAKKMFTDKVVNINNKLPFFFKPIMDGMDKPKTELAYRVPASKITKNNMHTVGEDDQEGLNTTIDWRNTEENAYDGEKLLFLAHDESGKWVKPNNILNNWRVTKTCLRVGKKIIGKCMMGSTSNALSKGGENYQKLYNGSRAKQRSANGQTKTGLYALFIPMEFNLEGFIDVYGNPVMRKPVESVLGVDGEMIDNGAIDFWDAEVEALKNDPDALNEHYRQFPRTEDHAFRDDSKDSLFDLTKIYDQIDYNNSFVKGHHLTRGNFSWENGVRDTKVIFTPSKNGRFILSWVPPATMQNKWYEKNGTKYPALSEIGAFGCDSYDISGTVGGGGSNGALHGLTGTNMADYAPSNEFFLEYIARPKTAEIFFEDVLMAIIFYSMPILAENNKPRLLYHIKNRGYRGFSMNRPDKPYKKLSVTEKELGGIPNSSEDVKQTHAAGIESYINEYVGVGDGQFREAGEMGVMPFNRTLLDWAKFDIANRTRFDASISSGLAIMATRRHLYQTKKEKSKIKVNFARYNNKGMQSSAVQ
jgi:hypothetical protein